MNCMETHFTQIKRSRFSRYCISNMVLCLPFYLTLFVALLSRCLHPISISRSQVLSTNFERTLQVLLQFVAGFTRVISSPPVARKAKRDQQFKRTINPDAKLRHSWQTELIIIITSADTQEARKFPIRLKPISSAAAACS